MLCCPEDVERSGTCEHDDESVCARCRIPICNECYSLLVRGQKIPKALCNDNYISYQHRFIVVNKVTWLEATIACPIFTGLITYYIEGEQHERGHLMQEGLGHLQRAYGVRGNCFSFLLPWDTVMKTLSRAFAEGDFSEWPLDQDTAAQVVRVTMVRGHEALLDQFKELKVRSRVVKAMANLYVDNHLAELISRASVVKLLAARRGDLRQQFREHIELRVDAAYPANQHGDEEGSVPERMRACFAEARREALEKKTSDTAFDQKQATGHDLPSTSVEVLADLRPSIVVGERTTQDALPQEVVVQSAFNKVTGMGVRMGQDFEPQFNASYMARAYPWALNYSCGGADYPDLFGDWNNQAVQGREALAQSDGCCRALLPSSLPFVRSDSKWEQGRPSWPKHRSGNIWRRMCVEYVSRDVEHSLVTAALTAGMATQRLSNSSKLYECRVKLGHCRPCIATERA